MTKKLKMLLGALAVPALTASLNAQTLLGTYEFTDNSLTATDADGVDGITFSNFGLGGGAGNDWTTDELFSDAQDTTADTGLDYISLTRAEVGEGSTSTQLTTNERYFSFTITNNSGDTLSFSELTLDITNPPANGNIGGVQDNRYHNTRVYNTATPSDIVGDTIGQFGKADNTSTLNTSVDLTTITLADSTSMTFYIPWVAEIRNNDNDNQYLQLDNLRIYGAVPEPGSYALLAGLSGLAFVMLRRRK